MTGEYFSGNENIKKTTKRIIIIISQNILDIDVFDVHAILFNGYCCV
jgi:hypothetical protein